MVGGGGPQKFSLKQLRKKPISLPVGHRETEREKVTSCKQTASLCEHVNTAPSLARGLCLVKWNKNFDRRSGSVLSSTPEMDPISLSFFLSPPS